MNTEEVRKLYLNSGKIQTHSENCWQWHPECCIGRLCDEIDRLRITETQRILEDYDIVEPEQFDELHEILNKLEGKDEN